MTNPPNIMMAGTWILVAIVALAIFIPALVIGLKLFSKRVRWRNATTSFPLKVFGPVTDGEVVRALHLALSALAQVWPEDVLRKLMLRADLRIYVMPEESWLNVAKVRVGGEQDGNILSLNRSMTSLCHELAHFCEAKLDLVRDDAHAGWASKRIWAADEEYRRALVA